VKQELTSVAVQTLKVLEELQGYLSQRISLSQRLERNSVLNVAAVLVYLTVSLVLTTAQNWLAMQVLMMKM